LVRWFVAHPIFDAAADGLVVRPLLTAAGVLEPALTIGSAAVLAGVYPAWRAARTDAARVLRGLS
jgi:ABC-type antimicrobial peptide transport system permease subunit